MINTNIKWLYKNAKNIHLASNQQQANRKIAQIKERGRIAIAKVLGSSIIIFELIKIV